MKTLIICRHAKSDWSMDLPDFERPLNSRGMKDAPRMGKMLLGFEFYPDLIVSSPANRAKTTAEAVATEISYPLDKIRLERNIYYEGAGSLLSLIQDLPETADSVMVFGHNPTQEGIVRMLLGARAQVTMPTLGMACFDLTISSWSQVAPETSALRWFLIPKLLKNYLA